MRVWGTFHFTTLGGPHSAFCQGFREMGSEPVGLVNGHRPFFRPRLARSSPTLGTAKQVGNARTRSFCHFHSRPGQARSVGPRCNLPECWPDEATSSVAHRACQTDISTSFAGSSHVLSAHIGIAGNARVEAQSVGSTHDCCCILDERATAGLVTAHGERERATWNELGKWKFAARGLQGCIVRI